MIERLAVAPGEGTVIRHGHVAAWAGESASVNLLTFLAESARNLAASPIGGDQLADHLAGVLHRRDPEPDVPFVVIGPSEEGWVALLHGPVRVWDGEAWTAPSPHRGWMRASLSPHPVLVAGAISASDPVSSDGSHFHLEGGVVPGGGFSLAPSGSAARQQGLALAATAAVPTGPAPLEPTVFAHPEEPEMAEETSAPMEVAAEPEAPEPEQPDVPEAPPEVSGPGVDADLTALLEAVEEASDRFPTAAASDPAPPGVLDLRRTDIHVRVPPRPPLPAVDQPGVPAGAAVIAGVNCGARHLNRPGMTRCARCRQPIITEAGYQVTGARPALGCLITDGGSVYRLDSGYLVGSDPAKDPTVRGRLARPLPLTGNELAAAHAEIRLQDWDVVLTDRASDGGTFVFAPDGPGWERLQPYEPRVLEPGSHVAFGQSVVTFVSPWRDDT